MELPKPGDTIGGKHRIEGILGEGGFGVVFRATTIETGRPVAIKLLKPGAEGYDPTRLARYMRELRAIAKLQSPHTLTLFDYGETDGGFPYMVTEFIEGQDLSDIIRERTALTEGEAIHVLLQTLYSLREAHDLGILHRDIKPANIRVFEQQGEPLCVKVLDFGLAKPARKGNELPVTAVTAAGNVIGTPRYMSPEQLTGKPLTGATDIYSLGVVGFEMLRGQESTILDIRGMLDELSLTIADGVSAPVRAVINRMLKRDPAARYATVEEVVADLRPLRRAVVSRRVPVAPLAVVAPRQALKLVPDTADTIEDSAVATHDLVPEPPVVATAQVGFARVGSLVAAAAALVAVCAGVFLFLRAQGPAPAVPRTDGVRKAVAPGTASRPRRRPMPAEPRPDWVPELVHKNAEMSGTGTSVAVDDASTVYVGFTARRGRDAETVIARRETGTARWSKDVIERGLIGIAVARPGQPAALLLSRAGSLRAATSQEREFRVYPLDGPRAAGLGFTADSGAIFLTVATRAELSLFSFNGSAWETRSTLAVGARSAPLGRPLDADGNGSLYVVHANQTRDCPWGVAKYSVTSGAWAERAYYPGGGDCARPAALVARANGDVCTVGVDLSVRCGNMEGLDRDVWSDIDAAASVRRAFVFDVAARPGWAPPSILEGQDGTLILVYSTRDEHGIRLARKPPQAAWSVRTVLERRTFGLSSAMGPNGRVWISYYVCEAARCEVEVVSGAADRMPSLSERPGAQK